MYEYEREGAFGVVVSVKQYKSRCIVCIVFCFNFTRLFEFHFICVVNCVYCFFFYELFVGYTGVFFYGFVTLHKLFILLVEYPGLSPPRHRSHRRLVCLRLRILVVPDSSTYHPCFRNH